MSTRKSRARKQPAAKKRPAARKARKKPTRKGTKRKPTKVATRKPKKSAPGKHTRSENYPWSIWVEDHEERSNSPEYVKSRTKMNKLARTVAEFYYGVAPYEDHHGGGLWLKDADGWFIVRNLAGMEWSSQFCADPAKVDQLRLNARRIYDAFPEAVKELGIRKLLDTPIKNATDVARWADSICNASLPLPKPLHTGVLPKPGKGKEGQVVSGGFHHYPAPIVDQQLFKYDDFQLWVTYQDEPVAVVPVGERGSGDGRTAVIFASPGTDLATKKERAAKRGEALILDEDDELSLRACNEQYAKVYTRKVPQGDPLTKVADAESKPSRKARRVSATKYRIT